MHFDNPVNFGRRSTVNVQPTLDKAWMSDLTYIRIATDFVFLAVILDARSRRTVDWAISRHIDVEPPAAGRLHSSLGPWRAVCGESLRDALVAAGLVGSMSRKGNPSDNASAESFINTLKRGGGHQRLPYLQDVINAVPTFIQAVYNRKRLH